MSHSEFTSSTTWGGRPVARRVADARDRGRVVVTGTVLAHGQRTIGGTASCTCTVGDGTGAIDLVFLGRRAVPGLVEGACCTIEGTARSEGRRLVVWNPMYRIEPPRVAGRAGAGPDR